MQYIHTHIQEPLALPQPTNELMYVCLYFIYKINSFVTEVIKRNNKS